MSTNLIQQGEVALAALLMTVQPYNQNDWELAYSKIDYDIGKSSPTQQITRNCISNELLDIARSNSWYLTHHYGDTYIFNGQFWIKLEKVQLINFVKDIAIKMGRPRYEAGDKKFGKELYEQLLHDGRFISTSNPTEELLLNMENGTLEITNSGIQLRNFDYKDFLTYQLNFKYAPSAVNQEWLDFLEEVLPEEDSRKTLQQSLGSLLLRGLKTEKVILLYGTGSNGKSVIFEVLSGLLGEESISNYSLNSLADSKGYHRANLKDKLINYASDIDLSKIDTGVFKTLASGEPIESRLPYKEPFVMKNYAKMIFNLNDISNAKVENTHGFFRRLLFIPFEVTITKSQQDKTLHQKLLQNKEGIFNWLLDGAREVMANEEIFESQESQDFLLKFKQEPTMFERFIHHKNVAMDSAGAILSSTLYDSYKKMCEAISEGYLSQIAFSRELVKKGFTNKRVSEGVQWQVSYNP